MIFFREELIHFQNDEVDFFNSEEATQENKTEIIPPPVKSSSPKLGVGLNKPAVSFPVCDISFSQNLIV